MLKVLLRYCWSISIPRFGTKLTKKILKIFAVKNLPKIFPTSYKKLLGRVAFGIIYIASVKSRSTRGASHQPAFIDSYRTINRTRLACRSSR